MTKYVQEKKVEDRIKDMWKVHKNRVDQGKGSTYQPSGYHESMELQGSNFVIPKASVTAVELIDGA